MPRPLFLLCALCELCTKKNMPQHRNQADENTPYLPVFELRGALAFPPPLSNKG
jgi:hypothetical protein